jgi:hypothetical protein
MKVGDVFVGVVVYFAINLVGGFLTVGAANGGGHNAAVATGAVLFALIAFGGGGAMMATGSSSTKAMGLGLMIGWALTSILSVGMCTGLNPTLYKSS